ncbi:MAG TPA: hypothetical protein VFY23_16985 [Candidatus Limnocylindrales bacterium]|nr:hypothetical protein [Candidatus Limnocylindrales bacterium]
MKRILSVLLAMIAVLAIAAPAAAAAPERPRGSYSGISFQAYAGDCGRSQCTDYNVWAEQYTDSQGGEGTYVCVDVFTYSTRTGRGTSASGCADGVAFSIASDLSSASLPATSFEICGRSCHTVTVAAALQATSGENTYRSRSTQTYDTCTYTYTDTGTSREAAGTLTWDGTSKDAYGSIQQYESTYSERCK